DRSLRLVLALIGAREQAVGGVVLRGPRTLALQIPGLCGHRRPFLGQAAPIGAAGHLHPDASRILGLLGLLLFESGFLGVLGISLVAHVLSGDCLCGSGFRKSSLPLLRRRLALFAQRNVLALFRIGLGRLLLLRR